MNKKKTLIIIITLILACICMHTNKVEAALQANGGGAAKKDINGWITSIRKMQTAGQALGLTDTINGTNLTSENKNLDIHMQKNTEYGAVILLGASAYGNENKMNTNGVTTTGNKTGVVMQINKEWVSAGISNIAATSMKNAAGRYKNVYPTPTWHKDNYVEKAGDAIYETRGWHGSKYSLWLCSGAADNLSPNGESNANAARHIVESGLLRSYSGSVFSYFGNSTNSDNNGNSVGSQPTDANLLSFIL